MITDQSALVDEVCQDFWRSRIMGEPEEFLEQLISRRLHPGKTGAAFQGALPGSGAVGHPRGR